jgi:hypothetical protein
MKKLFTQLRKDPHGVLAYYPLDDLDEDITKELTENQILETSVKGTEKERSLYQLHVWWAFCEYAKDYTGIDYLDTKRKMSDYVLYKINYVEYTLFVDNKAIIKPKSISYKALKHMEACEVFTKGFNFMAETLCNTTSDELFKELVRLGKIRKGIQ